ncbi:MAG: hypothetical protein H0U46_03575 [Actinobacteria bacterium]|nr:hypothetical protein [Actinomycetota bacterium]
MSGLALKEKLISKETSVRILQVAAFAVVVAFALAALRVAPAAGQAAPTLKIVGFASTLGDGRQTPRPEAKDGGTITKCRDKQQLSAIFMIGNVASGSRYRQSWTSRGKTVFLDKSNTISRNIRRPTRVFVGFTKNGLRNGKYVFRLVLNGKRYVLGSVTRNC